MISRIAGVLVVLMVASLVAHSGWAQDQGAKKKADETVGEIITHDRQLHQLEKRLSIKKLQADLVKAENEIQKTIFERTLIGKKPEKSEELTRATDQEVVYYDAPPTSQPVAAAQLTADPDSDEEDEKENKKPEDKVKVELENAVVLRTFREVGQDSREAIIQLSQSQVPVHKGTQMGKWQAMEIASEMVIFENNDTGETIIVGF